MKTPYKIKGKTVSVGDIIEYDGRKYEIKFEEYKDSESYTHHYHYGIVVKGRVYIDGYSYINDMSLPDFVSYITQNKKKTGSKKKRTLHNIRL